MAQLSMTEEMRKVAQQWPRSEITCKDVFDRLKPKFPAMKIVSVQNMLAHHKKLFIPLRWEVGGNRRKHRIYQIAHGEPGKRKYTTTLEIGESIYAVLEDRNETIDKLKERLKDFSSMVEENKTLREQNQELNLKLAEVEGRRVLNKDIGLTP